MADLSGWRLPDRRAGLKKKYFVYVFWCAGDRSRYVGQTDRLLGRMEDHLKGKVAFTKPRRPIKLVYLEAFETKKEALAREKYLKSRSGRRSLDKIVPK